MSLLIPKLGKKRNKPRKPLKRTGKKIAARAKFKEFGANPFKTYRRKFTDAEVAAKAEEFRQKRFASPTSEELAMAEILHRHGIKFVREKVFLNGDRFVLADIFVPSVGLVIELDGHGHSLQRRYDHQRTMWLARVHKVKVVRFFNSEVRDGTAAARLMQMLGLVAEQ